MTQNNAVGAPGPQPYQHSYPLAERTAVEQQQNHSAPMASSRRQYVYPEVTPTNAPIVPGLANAVTMPPAYQYTNYQGPAAKTYPPNTHQYQQQQQQQQTYLPGPQHQPQQLSQPTSANVLRPSAGYKFPQQAVANGYAFGYGNQQQTQSAPISPTNMHFDRNGLRQPHQVASNQQPQLYQQAQQYVSGMGGGLRPHHGHQTTQQVAPLAAPGAQQTQQPLSAPVPVPVQAAMTMPVPIISAQEGLPNSGSSNGAAHHRLHQNHNHHHHHHHQGYYSSNTQSPQSHSHSPKHYPQQHMNPMSNSPLHHYPNQQQQQQPAVHSRPQSRPQSRHHSRPTSRAHSPSAAQLAPAQQHRLHKPSMGTAGASQQQQPQACNAPAAANAFPTRWPSRPSVDSHDYAHPGYQPVAYLRNENRVVERSKFTTLMHCLEPVALIDKLAASVFPPKGNLYPLYKASEDWIAPNVGLPFENKPGYKCLLYVVDGTLLYDNGLSGEKLLSKGTVHLSSTNRETTTYVRNPSKTHRVHIIRLWIDMAEHKVEELKHMYLAQRSKGAAAGRPDFHYQIRHVADSDKENCLLVLSQPSNYHPSFGMTSKIYGPMVSTPKPEASRMDLRSGAVSPLGSTYYLSQSMIFTRPDYFMSDTIDPIETAAMSQEWGTTDPQLTSRVCADPLLLDDEDIFVAVCSLGSGEKVVFEPFDLNDSRRRKLRKKENPQRAGKRRVWVQTIMNDINAESCINGGRLAINGDMASRMKPGDSAYVRKIDVHDDLVFENYGRTPIEFLIVDTPY
ncbi:hypothetical protein IWW45_003130 [Coemansia sp. RSA 485]|nr:hypothetical protein IWW45_003130 [Coemansia sp. RSA 485]